MVNCIRCREELSMPEANYCGHSSFPILNDLSEDEVRERARDEQNGFLDGCDYKTILDTRNGDPRGSEEGYQWYLEEAVKKSFQDLAILHHWDWFDEGRVSGLFLTEDVLELDPSSDAWEDFVVWVRVMVFFLESFQPEGLELGIRLAAWMNEDVDAVEDVEVTISISPDDETDSEVSGPAS